MGWSGVFSSQTYCDNPVQVCRDVKSLQYIVNGDLIMFVRPPERGLHLRCCKTCLEVVHKAPAQAHPDSPPLKVPGYNAVDKGWCWVLAAGAKLCPACRV